MVFPPDRADLLEILRLRLLICRAAATDSLSWWEDASLTEEGRFLLGRLFPRSDRLAARRLALEAALLRHDAALNGVPHAQHLFDLGAEVEIAVQDIPLDEPDIPEAPIQDVQTLVSHIGTEVSRTFDQADSAVLRVPSMSGATSPRQRALALATAYATGRLGEPVFPIVATQAP